MQFGQNIASLDERLWQWSLRLLPSTSFLLTMTLWLALMGHTSLAQAQEGEGEARALAADAGRMVSMHTLIDKITLHSELFQSSDSNAAFFLDAIIFGNSASAIGDAFDSEKNSGEPVANIIDIGGVFSYSLLDRWITLKAYGAYEAAWGSAYDRSCDSDEEDCSENHRRLYDGGNVGLAGAGVNVRDYFLATAGYVAGEGDSMTVFQVGIPMLGLYNSTGF
ncbi:MAG: hypothetical protein ABIG71_00255, partial [Candidatus Uhrbacteria bacterium]